jgi:phage tail sheath protein FI
MKTYHWPGIYLEEESVGPRPIQAVGTSTAAFVGIAPDPTVSPGEAIAINSWTEFRTRFVGEDSTQTDLAQAVYGFFLNGGSRCYVVNLGQGADAVPLAGGARRGALDALAEIDEIAIVAAPGMTDPDSTGALLDHCEILADRVAVLDGPATVRDMSQLVNQASAGAPTPPAVRAPPSGPDGGAEGAEAAPRSAPSSGPAPGLRPRRSDGGWGAVYFPHLWVRDPFSGDRIQVPPSGHIAGIWARTDATRGVHKAPANETVRGALDLSQRLTDQEQGVLNDAGVNAIRFFSSDGIKVWGARTLADPSSEWRYLNVRRLITMVEESIVNSTRWIVFEPNDPALWKAIRRDVTHFLTRLWSSGALFGRTPEESFFVRCDSETNPPEVIDAGQVVTLIGLAPVKPAEFIVFRISQFQGGSEIDGAGTEQ